jgi:hypothetical protein
MAFKMKGNPMDFVRSQKIKGNKTLAGEHPNTDTDQRREPRQAINDLEDRIEFLSSEDNPTNEQKASLKALRARLKKMKA